MGIKSMVVKAAGKAGDAIAKISSLSPEQLENINRGREDYLSQMPDPNDPTAEELTRRLLSASGIEIYSAYLPQIKDLYSPVDPTVEYAGKFDAAHNIRLLSITKWVIDPDEDSLEKLVSVYDVLSSEDCNVALVFNRTKTSTNVYLAIANMGNAPSNTDAESFRKRTLESPASSAASHPQTITFAVFSTARKLTSGFSRAACVTKPPLPQPISRWTGLSLPNSAARSSVRFCSIGASKCLSAYVMGISTSPQAAIRVSRFFFLRMRMRSHPF